MFTGAVQVELANPEHRWPRPDVFTEKDASLARFLEIYKALAADQIDFLGFNPKRMSKLSKYGFVYRWRLRTEVGTLPSAFSLGPVARKYMGVRFLKFSDPRVVQSLLAVNQLLLFLRRFGGTVDVDPSYPRAVYTLNRPTLILAPRETFYPEMMKGYPQGIIVLPDPSMAVPGIPVRYCFDSELSPDFVPLYDDALQRADLAAAPK